jgi:NitT/TauT family transport system permease protein
VRNILSTFGNLFASIGFVLLIWQLVTVMGLVNTALFPSPGMVALAFVKMYADGVLMEDLMVSLKRASFGFFVGGVLGIISGLLTSRVKLFRILLYPFFNILRPIPAIALVPVAIVWFGIGEDSKYFVISYTVFLAVWLSTHHGMELVPETYIRASRTLGASRFREYTEVVIPAAAPYIFAGLRFGAALAFLSLVAAELTGASAGIGYRIDESRQYFLVDRMFVGLIELGVLGALLDTFFVFIGKRVLHWESN